ncbi:MAG: DEAD/DEAH box helicase [Armatimonadetes bacterium]|nr:DEAD/DEAH box helicase [Armatimonadota bacterium]
MEYHGIALDPFQIAAIRAVEQHHTVIVAAPTGAGKTVIAEYAVEQHLGQNERIIYTAPIKALSNQKFRDFSAVWGDRIGIVTGDVSLNPEAPVLLMTTEIFRNTVFDDPERLHDVRYVILDEIHYINDIQRGTVWEESLLFAPPHIGFICLSATIPNLEEFAGWIREVRPEIPVETIREDHRPVPLEHHLWLAGCGEASLQDLRRLDAQSAQRRRRLRPGEVRHALGAGKRDPAGQGDIVAHLDHLGRLPALYFCFSRSACEENARRYARGDLLDETDRLRILELFDSLAEQFELQPGAARDSMRGLIGQGVAFHHAGMLPLLKEIVERIFSSGLLRLLFTTETFAVGVNMPAATVVFEALEKYDGVDTRYLLTREYQQMAGRAGRRGIDEIGYVYARLDPAMVELEPIERILTGQVEPTESQFNLSYSSVLSLYDQFGEGIYDVCHRSFANYQNLSRVRELEGRLAELQARDVPRVDCIHHRPDAIATYRRMGDEHRRLLGRAEGERRRIERRYHGKGQRRALEHELKRIEQPIERIHKEITECICHTCPRKKLCGRVQHQIDEHYGRVDELHRTISHLRHHQRDQIAKRLLLLREFDYLDEHGLAPKGNLAAAMYGFELPITELFYGGFFEDATEVEIGCLMVAVVYESKRSVWYAPVERGDLASFLNEADWVMRELARRERELGIDNGTTPLDPSLTLATAAWLEGGDLEELLEFTDASAGDIVRTFRHAVDLLRQFRRALTDHPMLQDRLQDSIRRFKRDEVDAERQLRLGHQVDLAGAQAAD